MKKTKTTRKNLTEAEYTQIKQLSELNLTPKQISKIINRSTWTIKRVVGSQTLSGMREQHRLEHKAYMASKLAAQEAVVEDISDQLIDGWAEDEVEIEKFNQTTTNTSELIDALDRINDTLDRLVEAWNKPDEKKRRLF